MNVLQVTAWDNIGQRFNGYQLHNALKELGHESFMAVMRSRFPDVRIHEVGNVITRKLDRRLMTPIEDSLSIRSVLPLSASTLYFAPHYRHADLVHLQLIHADRFFSLFNVPVMTRQHRVIWTLHDPWIASGHCIHSSDCDRWLTGCGNCPDLTLTFPIRHDTSALQWKLKHWVMHHSNVTLIVASPWMAKLVKRSPILSHLPCHLIPFGVDLHQFKPRKKARCRHRFGIPENACTLAFRFRGEAERFKGWAWLEKALISLEVDRPTYLLTFEGKGGMGKLRQKYEVIELGWVHDEDLLVDALSAADIFLMPSLAEAFGMMAVEAMACGTPVIAFAETALPDTIHAPHGGIAVPYKDHLALGNAIRDLLLDLSYYEKLVHEGLRIVRQEYSLDLYVQRHMALYESLME